MMWPICEKSTFEYSMCKLIAEVVKVKDGTDYPGATLYQLCVAIQKYLFSKGLYWKLIDGGNFDDLRTVLDNIMKERAAQSIGTTKRRANLLSIDEENIMWNEGILGDSNPDQLRNTVLFLIGINIGLRAGDEHYNLRRDSQNLASQLQFKRNKEGVRCSVYTEDCTTKTNDGGLNSMRKERKVVWVYPSANSSRCPVRIIDKFMSLLPPVRGKRKANLYLRSLERYTPVQWYGEQVVGLASLRKIMTDMSKKAKLEGFFTNHSLRRSATTRLFQAGVDRKLIKEFTGHSSDAVDAYQITSDEQRRSLSAIIGGNMSDKPKPITKECTLEVDIKHDSSVSTLGCNCVGQKISVSDVEKLGSLLNEMILSRKGDKAKIKLEVQFEC